MHFSGNVITQNCSNAFPALAVSARLQATAEGELPSWAAYLPETCLSTRRNDRTQPVQGEGCTASIGFTSDVIDNINGQYTACMWESSDSQGSDCHAFPAACEGGQFFVQPSVVSILGQVWSLSRDSRGCRLVQEVLHEATEEDRAAVIAELHGHIWQALQCPHANYVVQKCIDVMRPHASQFIVDELMQRGPGAVVQAARHRFGCRILQRLLEHCSPLQVQELCESLLNNAVALCTHQYGNYVMQHLLDHGTESQRHRLTSVLVTHAYAMGSDGYACGVVRKALSVSAHDDQVALARALLAERGLLTVMARNRHGHIAAKLVLQALEGDDLELARRQLAADAQSLSTSRYGRFVVACLGPSSPSRAGHIVGGG